MKFMRLHLILFFIVVFGLAQADHLCALTLITPKDNATTTANSLAVVVEFEDEDSFEVYVGGYHFPGVSKSLGKKYGCLRIDLMDGLNEINIHGLKDNKKVSSVQVNIVSKQGSGGGNDPLPKYPDYTFHFAANENMCYGCHKKIKESEGDRLCITCHNNYFEYTFQHAPVEKNACSDCHVDEGREGKGKYEFAKPIVELCKKCHKQIADWQGMKKMHGPAAVGGCLICHDPHAADYSSLNKSDITDSCLTCHASKEYEQHVLARSGGRGHPLRGRSDPLRPEREFTCAGCHNPHASESYSLMNFKYNGPFSICRNCHKK